MSRYQTVSESVSAISVGDRGRKTEKAAQWEWVRQIALAVNRIMLGRTNNVIEITLDSGTSTTVEKKRFKASTVLHLEPTNASAAGITGIHQAATVDEVVITHSTAAGTETFRATYWG